MATKKATAVAVQEESAKEVELSFRDRAMQLPGIRRLVAEVVDSVSSSDPAGVSLDIVERILNAEDEEGIFGATGELIHARDFLMGVPIEVVEIRWNESTIEGAENSLGFYCVFDYVDLRTAEKAVGSVGALQCMAQLQTLNRLGMLPYSLVLTRTQKPTQRGFYPLFFRPMNDEEKERVAVINQEEEAF